MMVSNKYQIIGHRVVFSTCQPTSRSIPMKSKIQTSSSTSNLISAKQKFSKLVEFVEFAEAIAKGARPDFEECRKFRHLENTVATKAASVIKNRGGKGIKKVRLAWLTVVQSLIAVDSCSLPDFESVAEHLENPELTNPPPIYQKFPTPTDAAEYVRSCVADSMQGWSKGELLECSLGRDKWFGLMAREALTTEQFNKIE
jgi:hypothetical protein